jgi:hypothetical protein
MSKVRLIVHHEKNFLREIKKRMVARSFPPNEATYTYLVVTIILELWLVKFKLGGKFLDCWQEKLSAETVKRQYFRSCPYTW